MGKLLHLGYLENNFIDEMDVAANIFVENLVKLSENKKFIEDTAVEDKLIRYACDNMLKGLMGDINNDIQTSEKNDQVLQTIIELNAVLGDHLKHTVRNMFVRMIPFNLGY